MSFLTLAYCEHGCVGYSVLSASEIEWQIIQTKPVITQDFIRNLFIDFANKGEDRNFSLIEKIGKVSLGTIKISNAYFKYFSEKKCSFFDHDGSLAFFAPAYNSFYADWIVWPVLSKYVYLLDPKLIDMYCIGKSAVPVSHFLSQKYERFELQNHPFTEKIIFSREYEVQRYGFLNRKFAVCATKDVISYKGEYDDATMWCNPLRKRVEKEPFWLIRHQGEVSFIKNSSDLPKYIKEFGGFGGHCKEF